LVGPIDHKLVFELGIFKVDELFPIEFKGLYGLGKVSDSFFKFVGQDYDITIQFFVEIKDGEHAKETITHLINGVVLGKPGPEVVVEKINMGQKWDVHKIGPKKTLVDDFYIAHGNRGAPDLT